MDARRFSRPAAILLTAWILLAGQLAQGQNVFVQGVQPLIYTRASIPGGKIFSYEIQLRGRSMLWADVKADRPGEPLSLWVTDPENNRLLHSSKNFRYFRLQRSGQPKGPNDRRLQTPIEADGTYFFSVDNSRSRQAGRNVQLDVYLELDLSTEESRELEAKLEHFYGALKKVFRFRDFQIRSEPCGFVNAFSSPRGYITLCRELIRSLSEQKSLSALPFILFHEVGHTFLRLWGEPEYDNEELADSFATAFLMLGGMEDWAQQTAAWWADQSSEREAIAKLRIDDRHSLSAQRARNILRDLGRKDEVLRRWQKVFVRNMQTEALKALEGETTSWVDREAVRKELRSR